MQAIYIELLKASEQIHKILRITPTIILGKFSGPKTEYIGKIKCLEIFLTGGNIFHHSFIHP